MIFLKKLNIGVYRSTNIIKPLNWLVYIHFKNYVVLTIFSTIFTQKKILAWMINYMVLLCIYASSFLPQCN